MSLQPAAFALDASGEAVAVIQATSAAGPGGARVLGVQQPVYSGDEITTDALGQAQILFRDQTRLVVAPNSKLLIDKFVYRGDASAAQVSINAVKGALRFMSGSSPSQVYSIRTPSATIGVRGTAFDVAIGEREETGLLLYSGAVRLCSQAGRCITVDDACAAALALSNGAVGHITSRQNRTSRLRARFPLFGNQSRLRVDFRVGTGACAALDASPSAPAFQESSGSGNGGSASSGPDSSSENGGGGRGDSKGDGDSGGEGSEGGGEGSEGGGESNG